MIFGIGVDTVELSRVERALADERFRGRVFTSAELELPLASVAARFAAREAAVKALRGLNGLTLLDLEVRRNHLQAPEFAMGPRLREVLGQLGVAELHLSLSHDRSFATAFVVAERGDPDRSRA